MKHQLDELTEAFWQLGKVEYQKGRLHVIQELLTHLENNPETTPLELIKLITEENKWVKKS